MRRFVLIITATMLAAGCAGEVRREVLVSAASSLTDAFAEIEAQYESQHPEVDIVLNLAGSSSLREQILSGAPVDVFASANRSNIDVLADAGLIEGPVSLLAFNQLTIAVPAGNPADVAALSDFARSDLLIGLCAPSVPCGQYAADTLANAGVAASPDTFEPDVRSLITKIGEGELDAGIVYRTDVNAARGLVQSVEIPDEYAVNAAYTIALITGDGDNPDAASFIQFVVRGSGRQILSEFGFSSP